jgi:hypothetical protein
MAMIHINRAGNSLGTFSEEEVREGVRTGRFLGTDLAWREGMASWQALSQFPEFAAPSTPSPGASAPQAPVPSFVPSAGVPAVSGAPRSGLPWEHRSEIGFFPAFFQTIVMVLLKPGEAFTVMRTEGGLGDPLIFVVIGGSIAVVIWTLVSMLFSSLGIFTALADKNQGFSALAGAGAVGIIQVIRLILTPLLVAIFAFVGAGILHLCLMLVGGAKKSFETTFRTLCFCHGATSLLMIVPCCGIFMASIWGLVVECIGLARSHETDTGRAVIAVLLPIIVGCGCAVLISLIFFGSMSALLQNQHQ